MFEFIYYISPYAPIIIFVASVLDIFFVTGFILYGAAMMSSVAMMHATGMITTEGIVASAYAGTLFGNTLNYLIGRMFGEAKYVSEKLQHPRIDKARGFLKNKGLLPYIFVCRFFGNRISSR